jgi:hypothetical protein
MNGVALVFEEDLPGLNRWDQQVLSGNMSGSGGRRSVGSHEDLRRFADRFFV